MILIERRKCFSIGNYTDVGENYEMLSLQNYFKEQVYFVSGIEGIIKPIQVSPGVNHSVTLHSPRSVTKWGYALTYEA